MSERVPNILQSDESGADARLKPRHNYLLMNQVENAPIESIPERGVVSLHERGTERLSSDDDDDSYKWQGFLSMRTQEAEDRINGKINTRFAPFLAKMQIFMEAALFSFAIATGLLLSFNMVLMTAAIPLLAYGAYALLSGLYIERRIIFAVARLVRLRAIPRIRREAEEHKDSFED